MSTERPESEQQPEIPEATLADTDEPQEDRGRIGYGRNERASSWALGAVLILLFAWVLGDLIGELGTGERKPTKILVCEDHGATCRILRRMLAGHAVTVVENELDKKNSQRTFRAVKPSIGYRSVWI